MSREDDLKEYIGLSFDKRKDSRWVKTSKRLNDYLYGRYNVKTTTKTRYTVNSAFSLVNLILPNFIINSPYFRVKPRNTKYYKMDGDTFTDGVEQINNVKAAITGEAVLNAHYEKNKVIFENRKAIQDALVYPFGMVKNGIRYEEKDGKVVNDEPYLMRVNPLDIGWDPMATGVDDASFIVHRIVERRSKLKKMFGSKVDDLTPELPEHVKSKLQNQQVSDKLSGLVTIYEVHDQENNQILYFGGSNRKLLEKKENELWFNGSHFDIIRFTVDNDKFLGVPMLQMVEDQMIAKNEIFTLMYEHLKKFPGQVYIDQDAVDDDQLKRMENSEQGTLNVVRRSDKIKLTQPLSMGADYYQSFRVVDDIINSTLGIPDFTSLSGSNRKSATEASFIQGDATVRRNYFLNIVKEFVLSGAEKQFNLKQQFMDEKEVIKAGGELNNSIFVASKEDIQGDYQFDFDVDSMAAINIAELQNLTQLLQIQAQNEVLHSTLRKLDPDKLARYLYKKGGVNIDMFASGELDEGITMYPERENEIAEKGDLMPRPKKGEDHAYHLKMHKEFLKDRIQKIGPQNAQQDYTVNQVINHIAETEMLAEEGTPKPQQAPSPDMQNQQEAMQPEGPQGPMQQIPQ